MFFHIPPGSSTQSSKYLGFVASRFEREKSRQFDCAVYAPVECCIILRLILLTCCACYLKDLTGRLNWFYLLFLALAVPSALCNVRRSIDPLAFLTGANFDFVFHWFVLIIIDTFFDWTEWNSWASPFPLALPPAFWSWWENKVPWDEALHAFVRSFQVYRHIDFYVYLVDYFRIWVYIEGQQWAPTLCIFWRLPRP